MEGKYVQGFWGEIRGHGTDCRESLGIDESTILTLFLKWNGITSMYLDHHSDKRWAVRNARKICGAGVGGAGDSVLILKDLARI